MNAKFKEQRATGDFKEQIVTAEFKEQMVTAEFKEQIVTEEFKEQRGLGISLGWTQFRSMLYNLSVLSGYGISINTHFATSCSINTPCGILYWGGDWTKFDKRKVDAVFNKNKSKLRVIKDKMQNSMNKERMQNSMYKE